MMPHLSKFIQYKFQICVTFLLFLIGYLPIYFYEVSFTMKIGAWDTEQGPIPPSGYGVYTKSCKILDMEAFNWDAYKYVKTPEKENCPLPAIIGIGRTLRLNKTWLYQSEENRPTCCYRTIQRAPITNRTKLSSAASIIIKSENCTPISKNRSGTRLGRQGEFFEIECNISDRANESNYVTWKTHFSSILPPTLHSNKTKEKFQFWSQQQQKEANDSSSARPPNVLLLELESFSRLHLKRMLPATHHLMMSNGFVEMKGYTRAGENTVPNIMATLGGYENRKYDCITSTLDNCSFVWDDFNERNYVTGLFEDAFRYAIFHYIKNGFANQPWDYYNRPLVQAYHQSQPVREGNFYDRRYCMGGRMLSASILKDMEELLRKMPVHVPYFIINFITSLSHYSFNNVRLIDPDYYTLLENLIVKGKYGANNTIIIVFGDHGGRLHQYAGTFQGYLEMSLTALYIWLPPSLRESKPDWYENLRSNSFKLISPLDLHATLKHIAQFPKDPQNEDDGSQKSFYSLFEPVPLERTCAQARIEESYCRCGVTPSIGVNTKFVRRFADLITIRVNSLTEPFRNNCHSFELRNVQYNREILKSDEILDGRPKYIDYLLRAKLTPGTQFFDARVRHYYNETKIILGEVQRVNEYASRSKCIEDERIKPYCYCRDYHEDKLKRILQHKLKILMAQNASKFQNSSIT